MNDYVVYDDKIAYLRALRDRYNKNSSDYVILDLIIEDIWRLQDLIES